MSGEKKTTAARNIIMTLHESGEIDDRRKAELEYKLQIGDWTVYDELIALLDGLTGALN